MFKKSIMWTVTAVGAAVAMTLGLPGQAFADGKVTWKNSRSGLCLTFTALPLPVADVQGKPCGGNWGTAQAWYDQRQSDGSYRQVHYASGAAYCLDGNYGQAYVMECNGGDWQRWWEISTPTGWALMNVHTGYVLEDNGSGSIRTNVNYGDSNSNQRWR
ncbi:RICIN domain-containing protein [Streptomyces goshikiensis]|uniref:RICIN domain-containing protein n=1 Tax=Streptomyces goshikiensis TaxID=1942 RepID=UPI0036901239